MTRRPDRRALSTLTGPGSSPQPGDANPYPESVPSGTLVVTDVNRSFGTVAAVRDVSVSLLGGGSLALLGPSGCGKTTLLRIIAGLERLDAGSVSLDGRVLTDATTFVPAQKRPVGMVFHDWALFPNMTVAANVAFGLRRRNSERVQQVLDMVGLTELADRKPHQLSAGQAQRVALARTLAPRPQLVLFDEPFSSLDADLRGRVRAQVSALMAELGISAVYVTHDQDEAFVLGDRIAVMRDGAIQQDAAPDIIYEQPASRWVADFVGGANWVRGFAADGVARTAVGLLSMESASLTGDVEVLVRPEQLSLRSGGDFEVLRVDYTGPVTTYDIIGPDASRGTVSAQLRASMPGPPRFAPGSRVSANAVDRRYRAFPPS